MFNVAKIDTDRGMVKKCFTSISRERSRVSLWEYAYGHNVQLMSAFAGWAGARLERSTYSLSHRAFGTVEFVAIRDRSRRGRISMVTAEQFGPNFTCLKNSELKLWQGYYFYCLPFEWYEGYVSA